MFITCRRRKSAVRVTTLAVALCSIGSEARAAASLPSPPLVIASNDNTHPAGAVVDGLLRIDIVAATGEWVPEGPRSPSSASADQCR